MDRIILLQLKSLEDYELSKAVEAARDLGYKLIYRSSDENPLEIFEQFDRIAGIIKENRHIWYSASNKFSRLRIPTITLGLDIKIDEIKIGKMAAMHFLNRGLTNFAWLNFGSHIEDTVAYGAYEKRIVDAGYSCHKLNFIDLPMVDELMAKLDELTKPISIFIAHDTFYPLIYEACKQLNLKIPNDVSILSKGNQVRYSYAMPISLSSIDLNRNKMIELAIKEIHASWHGQKRHTKRVLQPLGVIQRDSSNCISNSDIYVQKALDFIHSQATFGINAADVVKHVACARSTLDRAFQKQFKESVPNIIKRVKLAHAKSILIETNKTAAEIALESGFCHTAHLSKILKEETGMSVREFRKTFKK